MRSICANKEEALRRFDFQNRTPCPHVVQTCIFPAALVPGYLYTTNQVFFLRFCCPPPSLRKSSCEASRPLCWPASNAEPSRGCRESVGYHRGQEGCSAERVYSIKLALTTVSAIFLSYNLMDTIFNKLLPGIYNSCRVQEVH